MQYHNSFVYPQNKPNITKTFFSLIHFNITSLQNNFDFLHEFLSLQHSSPDIIRLSETRLKEQPLINNLLVFLVILLFIMTRDVNSKKIVFCTKMVFEDLYKKNMFFKDDVFYFPEKTRFLWSTKQNKNFCLQIMNVSLIRKSNVKSLFVLKTLTYLGPIWVQVQPV